jgi:hypothetical protein
MPVPVLPGPPGPLHPLIAAAALYCVVGLVYLALAGTELPDRIHPDRLDGARPTARAASAALVLALALLLWPTGPLLRAARTAPVRRTVAMTSGWSRSAAQRFRTHTGTPAQGRRADAVPSAARLQPVDEFDAEPDFSAAVARVAAACEQERLVDAVFLASALVDDAGRLCGPGHPQVLDATELLAHVAHLVGDEARSVQLYVHVARHRAWHYGVDHPGARAALDNAYSAWLSASGQAALRAGLLLVPCLRLLSGSGAPVTVSSERRLQALRAVHGSGW